MKTLLIPLDPYATRPLYLQIADYITQLAQHGTLGSGSQLLPTRSLADQLQVHRSTVINAYDELKRVGSSMHVRSAAILLKGSAK
jgi:GntR family transcriptional regulator/MocR family aminotransferase